jgi:hypothetical protein
MRITALLQLKTIASVLLIMSLTAGCKKPKQVVYEFGTFPDTSFNLSGINSQYDDYNASLEYHVCGSYGIVFSSNRGTAGQKFDLVSGSVDFSFDQFEGYFDVRSEMVSSPFLTGLLGAANTPEDDLGPFRIISKEDSYEYLIITTGNPEADTDLKYLKYIPQLGSLEQDFGTLKPVTVLNSTSNDGYIAFDVSQKRVFFSSDRDGQFDIYTVERTLGEELSDWLDSDVVTPVKIDSINSEYDDKCPIVYLNMMVFASNRPEGLGGYDIYYSVYKNGKWGSPVNFGPTVNSEANEYRPVLGAHAFYTNYFLVYSSDRSGGMGNFDLYFAGVGIPGIPEVLSR